VDALHVMAYDFHGQWEQVVGHNSPLFPVDGADNQERRLTVVSVSYFYCILVKQSWYSSQYI